MLHSISVYETVPSPSLVKKNHNLSVRRQCELLHITRSTLYYEPKQPDAAALLLKEEIMTSGTPSFPA